MMLFIPATKKILNNFNIEKDNSRWIMIYFRSAEPKVKPSPQKTQAAQTTREKEKRQREREEYSDSEDYEVDVPPIPPPPTQISQVQPVYSIHGQQELLASISKELKMKITMEQLMNIIAIVKSAPSLAEPVPKTQAEAVGESKHDEIVQTEESVQVAHQEPIQPEHVSVTHEQVRVDQSERQESVQVAPEHHPVQLVQPTQDEQTPLEEIKHEVVHAQPIEQETPVKQNAQEQVVPSQSEDKMETATVSSPVHSDAPSVESTGFHKTQDENTSPAPSVDSHSNGEEKKKKRKTSPSGSRSDDEVSLSSSDSDVSSSDSSSDGSPRRRSRSRSRSRSWNKHKHSRRSYSRSPSRSQSPNYRQYSPHREGSRGRRDYHASAPSEGERRRSLEKHSRPEVTRHLWVGRFTTGMDYNTIYKDFSRYGKLESVNLLRDQRCAFVNFGDTRDAIEAKKRLEGGSRYPKISYQKPLSTPLGRRDRSRSGEDSDDEHSNRYNEYSQHEFSNRSSTPPLASRHPNFKSHVDTNED
jgi:hypothetical protein